MRSPAVRPQTTGTEPMGDQLAQPLRYWHTLRHLKPVQVYGRAWFRLHAPRPDMRPAPPLRRADGQWRAPARRRSSLQEADTFRLLNETGRIATPTDWNSSDHDKLWLYNLHYFDDLNADGSEARGRWHRALLDRWIAENAPGHGNGWEPYPLSLRIVNWVKWSLAGNALASDWVESLAVQARFLRARLEWHLLGNHLLANAKALVCAGLFFEGPEADEWRGTGLAILARELPEQVLADGGHFELSPMYHAIILEDLLDLINLSGAYPGPVPEATLDGWRMVAQRMRRWLAAMVHPDGEISFFNDAAIGVAPAPSEIDDYSARLGLAPLAQDGTRCRRLPDSGYIRLEGPQAVVLLDVGRIGPDHLPGHAHADTLSFEMSVGRQRLIVNSGTSVYGTGAERLRQRGTAAHNTVVVDGENSSEVWSGFRVARRARPQELSLKDEGWTVTCGHDGFARLPGRPRHIRTWQLRDDRLTVIDRVEGPHRHADAAFHFHPDAAPSAGPDALSGVLAISAQPRLRWRVLKGSARLEPATWHPEFGLSRPSRRLVVALADGTSVVEFAWT